MSRLEYTPILKAVEEGRSSENALPSDCYALAWAKDKNKEEKAKTTGPFHEVQVVRYSPKTKFQTKPIILLPLKPQLDERKFESHYLPANTKPEPKSELLTANALVAFENNAKRILEWSLAAEALLSKPNPEAGQMSQLAADCKKGKMNESVEGMSQAILGTVIPRNLPHLVEPWRDVKDKTRHVADSFSLLTKALTENNSVEARRLLGSIQEDLNQALSNGFDRASAVSDRLSKKQDAVNITELSAEDKRKEEQVKVLSAYQTLSYFVDSIESAVETLSEKPYGQMDEGDWKRLDNACRTFRRNMNGLKSEFNIDTLKMLEEQNVLTDGQRNKLRQFRQSIEQVLPALQSLENSAPLQGKNFSPVDSALAKKMSDIRRLNWKITDSANLLETDLSLKKEIKTAPAWKKPLLEQKLALWQDLEKVSEEVSDELCNDRVKIVNKIRGLDAEIYARKLKETTPESLKPLVNQYNYYDEFARVSEAIDAISRDAQDMLFLTGGYYSKQEAAVRVQERSNSLLMAIDAFKSMINGPAQQEKLSAMVNSKDLTVQQSMELKDFYSSLQGLLPQVDQLQQTVQLVPNKHFWKLSRQVRDRLDAAHNQGFKILLSSFDLHRQLNSELEKQKL